MNDIATVAAEIELRLIVPDGPSLPLTAGLRYDSNDPWAVRVAFRTGGAGDATVEWILARQLLTEGMAEACGEGDVLVWPARLGTDRVVYLSMDSPSGSALFDLDRDALVEFLRQTYVAVPTGRESDIVDFDAELALLLPQ